MKKYAVLFHTHGKDPLEEQRAFMCNTLDEASSEAAQVPNNEPQLYELVPGRFEKSVRFMSEQQQVNPPNGAKPARKPAKASKRRGAAKAGSVRLPKNGKRNIADNKRLRTRVLSCIASFQDLTKVQISKKLDVDSEKLTKLLPELVKHRLIGKKGAKYRPLSKK